VPRRVAALLAPPLRIRPLLVVAFTAIVLVSGVSALEAARDLHAIVELAQAPGIS
jgi:geranylgeranyl pyrophosphate synthase